METCCKKFLFCDTDPVWRTVAGRYCFVIQSQCLDLLQEGIGCDMEPVWRSVAGRYCFVIQSQCGELWQEAVV